MEQTVKELFKNIEEVNKLLQEKNKLNEILSKKLAASDNWKELVKYIGSVDYYDFEFDDEDIDSINKVEFLLDNNLCINIYDLDNHYDYGDWEPGRYKTRPFSSLEECISILSKFGIN